MCTLQDSFLVFVIIYWVETRYLNFLAINVISVRSLNSGIIANLIFVPAIIISNNFDEKKRLFKTGVTCAWFNCIHSFFLFSFNDLVANLPRIMQRNEQNVLANKTFYFGLTFFLLFFLAPAERKVQSYCARSINIPPLNGY